MATIARSSFSPAKKASPKAAKDGKSSGLQKPLQPSQELAAVIGSEHRSRGEVVSKVWDYIKSKGLQDKTDKRMINPDATLGQVTGASQISMFKMTGAVSKHMS